MKRTKPFREFLELNPVSSEFNWTPFIRMVEGSFLVAAGYHQEAAVRGYIGQRLDTLSAFTRAKDFDIYTDRDMYPDIPAGFQDKPLVKPELYAGGEERFPTIYDIHALANFPEDLKDNDTRQKIEAVIAYVLHPKYQAFPDGYGLMRAGKRRYHAIGWSVHLPGYPSGGGENAFEYRFVQRLVLMSRFQATRQHLWFQSSLDELENYRTERGTYMFPRSYLQERPSGYWVTGAYMALEENRRRKLALELESTFWIFVIKRNAGLI